MRVHRAPDQRETCAQVAKSNRARYRTGTKNRTREPEISDGSRTVQLQELIREEVNFLLCNTICDPLLAHVVVTMVELAGDGSCARIWFTAETEDKPLAALERAAGFLRSQLADCLGLKRTPQLRFRRDPVTRRMTPE